MELHLTPGTSREVFGALEAGDLDAALIVQPPFELLKTMRFTGFAQQRIGLLQSKGAENLPFILYSRMAWGGAACWDALQALTTAPKILAEMDAPETIALMVQQGLGQAVLPQWEGLAQRFPDSKSASWTQCPVRWVCLVGPATSGVRCWICLPKPCCLSVAGVYGHFGPVQRRPVAQALPIRRTKPAAAERPPPEPAP